MKIMKYYESNFWIRKIMSDAKKGITPEESINDKSLFRNIKSYYSSEIEIANKIAIENKEYVLKVILDGLKNGISMKTTIKNEFPNINIDEILNLLTDEDKELINKYNKEMSKSITSKKYSSLGKSERPDQYNNSVIYPFEDFYSSSAYKKYMDLAKED